MDLTISSKTQHIAIIMDGNGRWAQKRHLPRLAGHARGGKRVRDIVETCIQRNIPYLTLFAFSTENWHRPKDEVTGLMRIFVEALEREVTKLNENGVRLKIVGDIAAFDRPLQELIHAAEARTAQNTALTLSVAANYGGRQDIGQAMLSWIRTQLSPSPVTHRWGWIHIMNSLEKAEQNWADTERDFNARLSLAYAPDPDLLIRTGGEHRISNFMLWQMAYTELYFTDRLWPEFNAEALDEAIDWFGHRERRFGKTGAQVRLDKSAGAS